MDKTEKDAALERLQAAFSHLELDEVEAERLALEVVRETRQEKSLTARVPTLSPIPRLGPTTALS